MKAIKRVYLTNMPFDKWISGKYVHATGYEVKLEDGTWHIEYENNVYEDADDCIYEDEEMIVCEDVTHHMIVDISKNEDKYVVGLWYREELKNAKKSFDNLKEAYELFANMSKLFALGLYSVNDRFEIFNDEWTNWKWEDII